MHRRRRRRENFGGFCMLFPPFSSLNQWETSTFRNTKPRLNWTNSTIWCLRFYSSGSSVSFRLNWTNSILWCLRFHSSGSSVSVRLNCTNSTLRCLRFYPSGSSVSVKLTGRIAHYSACGSIRPVHLYPLDWTGRTAPYGACGSIHPVHYVSDVMWYIRCDVTYLIWSDVMWCVFVKCPSRPPGGVGGGCPRN